MLDRREHVLNDTENVASATPLHRTQLPGASRPLVSRSQIPMSTAHHSVLSAEHRLPGTVTRHSLGSSHPNRNSLGSANGYGLTAGMKIGSAPTTSISPAEPTLNHGGGHDAQMNGIDIERSYSTGGGGFY